MNTADIIILPSPNEPNTILTVNFETHPISLTLSRNDREVLSACLEGFPKSLPTISASDSVSMTLNWNQVDQNGSSLNPWLRITADPKSSTFHLHSIQYTEMELAVNLRNEHWFGLGHLMNQLWPLNRGSLFLGPLYPFDNGPTGICPFVEPTFFSTSGALVQADDSSKCLHVGINTPKDALIVQNKPLKWAVGLDNFDRRILPEHVESVQNTLDLSHNNSAVKNAESNTLPTLRIQARPRYDWPTVDHPWLGASTSGDVELKVTLGAANDVREACQLNLDDLTRSIPRSIPPPPQKLMEYPIWSTWARYKDAVTQEDVLHFAKDIVDRGLPRSVMGIDDRWSVKYGDLDFDKVKFPDPAGMVKQLHEMGFLVTLWVTPFANTDSEAVTNEKTRNYFVKKQDGEVGHFKWWQPTVVSALDMTNDEALDWFVGGLKRMCREYGIDGYKFDAGEPCFLPKQSQLEKSMKSPQEYTRIWIHKVASQFPVSEVRSGVRGCQNAAPMFRLFDKLSTWGLQNGLSSVLSALLTSSILGYPFCIPDYIGGNAYVNETPNSELMIRWAQMTAAMPAMQFSIPPWSLGTECEDLCQKALLWRAKFFWKHISACIDDANKSYTPITRPIWWLESNDKDACEIFDQFLVGDNVVVAPVISKGQTERNVYLPTGQWQRVNLESGLPYGDVYKGPNIIEDVGAALSEMPTFLRKE